MNGEAKMGENMRRIRRYYHSRLRGFRARDRRELRRKQPVRGLIVTTLRPALQTAYLLRGIREQLDSCGSAVEQRAGVPKWRQAVGILQASLRYGFPPEEYYQFRLYESEFWKEAPYFIHHHFMHVLLNHPPYTVSEYASDVLWNKLSFFEHCVSNGLPAIPVLAVVDGNGIQGVSWTPGTNLPGRDLFSKGLDLRRGEGARRWLFEGENRYRAEDGSVFDGESLLEDLLRESEENGYTVLLQERMVNHPDITELCGDTFLTLRIVTCLEPGWSTGSEYLGGIGCIPVGSSAAIELEPGDETLYSAIDGDGVLGPGVPMLDLTRSIDEVDTHPLTGVAVNGFRVPCWDETVDLVRRAHDTIPGIPFIGWDVGITEDGPVLIEGNTGWGPRAMQVPSRMPLGRTNFVKYYATYLEASEASDPETG